MSTWTGRTRLGAIAVVALAVYICLTGYLTTGLRLTVAGLALGHGLFVVPFWHSILVGLVLAAVATGTLLASCVAAYAAASRRWDFVGADWEEIVAKKGVRHAWNSLNANDAEGEHRRAARAARASRATSIRRAKRQARLATLAKAARLPQAADRRSRAAATHERAAKAQSRAVAEHERASGQTTSDVTKTTAGSRLLRILAGFNVIVLAGVLGVAAGQFVAEFESAWWAVTGASVAAFLLVYWLLTTLGPLSATPRGHAAAWVLVGALALLSSPPVCLLVLTGAVISTWGRRVLRNNASEPVAGLLRSPLPWLVAILYTLVGIGYSAMPPVEFDGVTVKTASNEFVGGTLARSSDGIHLVACTALADATSTGAYLHNVPAREIQSVKPSGTAAFDSGERPSLPALFLNLVGINWPRAVFVPNLRARKPTCADAPPRALSIGSEDPSLGYGAIVGPAPQGGRAADGEPPIEQTSDPRVARLARRYQPTVELTVADRFWPVSVGALLADIGLSGDGTCLFTPSSSGGCTHIKSVPATGQSIDYLRFPTTRNPADIAVTEDPTSQFQAFEAGQKTKTGSLHHWLADPGVLAPWRTAQLYFYYAGAVHFGGIARELPPWPGVNVPATPRDASSASDGLIGLQYWFFYPYNYYPLIVRSSLMNGAPIAGDAQNVDLHQGDWEHVTVLLDQRTLSPVALYMARHADEGVFYPWNSRSLTFDQGHPIVQAAFGGHPSYPNACGGITRTKHGGGLLSDWVVCGSGRFAFRAATTPLVDLASPSASWACWPGHFGEAKEGREVVKANADTLTTVITQLVNVAGPRAPLRQAENGSPTSYGVCDRGAAAAETDALHGGLAPVLTRLFGR